MPSTKLLTYLRWSFLLAALGAGGASAFLLFSRSQDLATIREATAGQFISKPGTGIFVEEVTSWVFNNKGFAKNENYCLLKSLGPTSRQVLDGGGDCADKSRLLATILDLYGMDATLVTLYACGTCMPTHVVVEARTDKGWMVSDPVFDMVFPDGDSGYHDLRDLKANPALLMDRLDELVKARHPRHPVARYNRPNETYDWAIYINWAKVPGSRAVAAVLERFGIDLYQVRRPLALEDPQLLLAGFAALLGAVFWVVSLILERWRARLTAPQSPAGSTVKVLVPKEHYPD